MVFIETPVFTKLITQLMSDDEYKELQLALVQRPECGVLIKNSGGLRKLRWTLNRIGKRGGVRIVYYWMSNEEQVFMLLAYQKSTQSDLTPPQLKVLRNIVKRWSW